MTTPLRTVGCHAARTTAKAAYGTDTMKTKRGDEKQMTIEEAIYCMKSYLPGNEVEDCVSCPYYGSVNDGDNCYVCRSYEAHRMAIRALEKMTEDT